MAIARFDNIKLNFSFLEQLLKNHCFHNLINLSFKNSDISDQGIQTFNYGKWDKLEEFNLYGNHLTNEGIKTFSTLSFPRLKRLDLSANKDLNNQAIEILKGENLPTLTFFSLSLIKNITSDVVPHLLKFPHLRSLDFYGDSLGDEGAIALANSTFRDLITLNIGGNNIGNKGAVALALSKANLPNLSSLNLKDNLRIQEGKQAIRNAAHIKDYCF